MSYEVSDVLKIAIASVADYVDDITKVIENGQSIEPKLLSRIADNLQSVIDYLGEWVRDTAVLAIELAELAGRRVKDRRALEAGIEDAVRQVEDRLTKAIERLRRAIEALEDGDRDRAIEELEACLRLLYDASDYCEDKLPDKLNQVVSEQVELIEED